MRNIDGEILVGVNFTFECGHRDQIDTAGPYRMAVEYKRSDGQQRECPSCTFDASRSASARCGRRVVQTVRRLVTSVVMVPTE